MKFSIVIPAHNEVESIGPTVTATVAEPERAGIDYEIVVVDDASGDGTSDVVQVIAEDNARVRSIRSDLPPGFGYAVRAGLKQYTGDAVATMMGDLSDAPRELVLYYRVLEQGYDCAFGTRFGNGGRTEDYPRLKLVLNRIVNVGIRFLFHHGYNDTTNAFKAYHRYVIDQAEPLLANHFNLTVEPCRRPWCGASTMPSCRSAGRTAAMALESCDCRDGSRYLGSSARHVWLSTTSRGDYRDGSNLGSGN